MKRYFAIFLIITLGVLPTAPFVFAQTQDSSEADRLQEEIDARKSQIDALNEKIDAYREQIDYYSRQGASLENDIALIENQSALLELDLEATEARVESKELEIALLSEAIHEQEEKIAYQRAILEETLFQLNKNGKIGLLEVLFSASTFNELFSTYEQLERVNENMNKTLDATKETRMKLSENRLEQEGALEELLVLEDELASRMLQLERSRDAKEFLIAQTEENEAQYRELLSAVRQEQALINQQLIQLQRDLEDQLSDLDEGQTGVTTFSWPLDGIITATYHDPTYPFRHLFEHGGLDIAAPTGTPIVASAPGYVAWARTGRSYGNYVMIVHANGYATLYAHMSQMNVVADQFVSRGEVIGYVGSTGLSTGPHLHFEVRENGIPMNPQHYLP